MTSPERSVDPAPIMLSAGEASGDLHGGMLCRALRELSPGLRLTGMGGRHMAAAGMEIVVDPTGQATVGTSEGGARRPSTAGTGRWETAPADRPRASCSSTGVQSAPGARRAESARPVVYLFRRDLGVARGRVRQMARRVKRVLAFRSLRFTSAPARTSSAIHATCLLDSRDEARRRLAVDPPRADRPAGSRPAVELCCPRCWTRPGASPPPTGAAASWAWPHVPGSDTERTGPGIPPSAGERAHLRDHGGDTLLTASGTATLEAALLGADGSLPCLAPHRAGRPAPARAQWIGLPNLVSGRGRLELIQGGDRRACPRKPRARWTR
jgi:lipid-A-disaccharide synthase